MNITAFYGGKQVLVTGGAGFVGSNLCHALVTAGANVTVVDNFHPDYGSNSFNLESIKTNLKMVRGDITDRGLMKELTSHADVIFHSAAQCSHVDSMVDPWLDLRFNNEGTLNLLEGVKEASRSRGRAPLVVYISTRAVIGAPLENPATETVVPNPTDVYGVNKLACEYYGAVYARVHRIPSIALRLTNSYGPRHQMKSGKYGILNWFMSLALQGKPIKIFGTGAQLRDYLFIDDAIEAVLKSGIYLNDIATGKSSRPGRHRLCGVDVPYGVFNLASGNPLPFVECAQKIVEFVPQGKLEMVPWPADRKAIETGDFIADSSEAHEFLQWKPSTSFDEGLKKTLSYYREHLSFYV